MERERRLELPRIGLRIIKSSVGVFLCYVIFMLRGNKGIPFYSMLAVLWCIQPYSGKTFLNAFQRTVGTLIGAFFGLIAILLETRVLNIFGTIFGYLVTAAMIIPVIYLTVVLKKQNASYFSCVVFLSITVIHIADENPFMFVANRVLDTFIGIATGVFVNSAKLPRKKNKDILHVAELDDMLSPLEEKSLSAYSKVEMNRMLDEGLKLSFATMRTPASLIRPLEGVNINLPVIVMDGAALYDMKEKVYLKTYLLSNEMAAKIRKLAGENGMGCFINALFDEILMIYYSDLKNDAEKSIYNDLRKSPYRNYARREPSSDDKIIYLLLIDETEKILEFREKLGMYEDELKILCYSSHDYKGFSYIKIYNKEADRENMLADLKIAAGCEKTVLIGSRNNDTIKAANMNNIVRAIKRSYEPFFINACNAHKGGKKEAKNDKA